MTKRKRVLLGALIVCFGLTCGAHGKRSLHGKATAATYVYEQRSGPIPPEVLKGLSALNAQGIVATDVDQNVTNGNGEIPTQYKVAIPTAKESGIPSLVVTAGEKVVRVVKNPQTESDVTGAVK